MLRDPKSIPASDIIIEDDSLEPYFITQSPTNGYTVYERVKKEKNKHEYIKSISYPSTFNNCLKKILEQLVVNSTTKHYKTLAEYLTQYNSLADKIKNISPVEI